MYRVMMEHYVNYEIMSSKPFRNFFMTITKENAGRACRGQPSATYEECEARWNRVNPGIQRKRKAEKGKEERKKDEEAEKRIADKVVARIGRVDSHKPNPAKKQKKARKGPFCKFYNKGPCPNVQSTLGCIGPNRVEYEHSCDVNLGGGRGVCGRTDHTALTHPGN